MTPRRTITVTQAIREGVRLIMFGVPCPTCGHTGQAMTLRDVGTLTGVSAATLSRFLNGRGIDSDTLDRLYEWVNARLPEPKR
jgi:Bacterial regulatory proteins, lacI family